MTQRLNAGIIGLGVMGNAAFERFGCHPQVDIVAITEFNAQRLNALGDREAIAARYTDPLAMLAAHELDIVYVASPNRFHAEQTIAALEQGAHVICEKPMAMTVADGRRMVETAARLDRRLMINFQMRLREGIPALHRMITRGELGDIYYVRSNWIRRDGLPGFGGWFGSREHSGGGPVIDLGVHMLDLALWFMGHPNPTWIMASTKNAIAGELAKQQGMVFDVEDFGCAMIKFDNGATLDLTTSWTSHIADEELMRTEVLGTRGGIRHTWGDGEFFTTRDGQQLDTRIVKTSGPPNTLHYFADCILTDEPHIATGQEGLRVMEIIEAFYKSAESGRPLSLAGA